MKKQIRALQEQRTELLNEAARIYRAAIDEKRKLTETEEQRIESLTAQAKTIKDTIAVLEEIGDEGEARIPGFVAGSLAGNNDNTQPQRGPFSSFGEQIRAIYQASRGDVDPRLLAVNSSASGGSARQSDDAGFLIQPEFVQELFSVSESIQDGLGEILGRCSSTTLGPNANRLVVPYIEDANYSDGSRFGGVQIYWAGEADKVTSTKPKIGKWECQVENLDGLAYATEEMLQDASQMESVYMGTFRKAYDFKLSDAVLRGDGAAKPLGVLNSAALVTVAKETGQAADTIVYENVLKMNSRLATNRGVWFANKECLPQLATMNLSAGTAGVPVWMPAGGISGAPYASLFGMPLIFTDLCSALGDLGDITLLDLSQYRIVRKGGLAQDSSMHVRFEYHEMAFRWRLRVNGQPQWKTVMTPYKGSATRSPFVTVAARA